MRTYIERPHHTHSLKELSLVTNLSSTRLVNIYKKAIFPMKYISPSKQWWMTNAQFKTAIKNIDEYLNKSK